MKTFEQFQKILNGSKEFSFEGTTTLMIRGYYSGEEVLLDLSKLTPEMYAEIVKQEPVEAIQKRCKEKIDGWEEKCRAALTRIGETNDPLVRVDYDLAREIQNEIENWCWDNDEDPDEISVTAEEVFWWDEE